MFLPARTNLFSFRFPSTFVPSEIKKKYEPYLNSLPIPIQDATEFINCTIVQITIPEMRQEPAVQQKAGLEISHRSSRRINTLFGKEFTVTVFLTEAYLNYWVLFECFISMYSFDNPKPYADPFVVFLLDEDEYSLCKIVMHGVLFTGISSLSLSHANVAQDFGTVDLTFTYNRLEITPLFMEK